MMNEVYQRIILPRYQPGAAPMTPCLNRRGPAWQLRREKANSDARWIVRSAIIS